MSGSVDSVKNNADLRSALQNAEKSACGDFDKDLDSLLEAGLLLNDDGDISGFHNQHVRDWIKSHHMEGSAQAIEGALEHAYDDAMKPDPDSFQKPGEPAPTPPADEYQM